MIGPDNKITLIDFGLAIYSVDLMATKKCGSPGYIAPELIYQPIYNEKVDMFSIGSILYILVSKKAPFPGRTAEIRLQRNLE
jgi:serine/threonine protein kinase